MVKLVGRTMPTIQDDAGNPLSPEDFLVYTARVSNPSNQLNLDTGHKLISYCIKKGHWSIFEHCHLTVEINTNLAIATQILRHASQKFQQFSGRYQKMLFGFDFIKPRRQDEANRQNSIDDLSIEVSAEFIRRMEENNRRCLENYEWAINNSVAKECARFFMPQNTMTRLYMTGNVRSYLAYLNQRLKLGTQLEHRQVAEGIRDIFIREFPIISATLNNFQDAGTEDFM